MCKTVASFVQNLGLIWLNGGVFSYSGHKCNCWLMCTGKEIRSGLKLVRMETDVATQTCKLLLRKTLNIGISVLVLL